MKICLIFSIRISAFFSFLVGYYADPTSTELKVSSTVNIATLLALYIVIAICKSLLYEDLHPLTYRCLMFTGIFAILEYSAYVISITFLVGLLVSIYT